jgi:hypothetical protein
MTYGRSIRSQQAIDRDSLPASHVASQIGHGCTAAWVRQYVPAGEWHHANTYRRVDGQPTNHYELAETWSIWFAANWHAARAGDRTARRRVVGLRIERRNYGVTATEVAEALRAEMISTFVPVNAPAAEETLPGTYDLVKRGYAWSRGRYRPEEETIRISGCAYRGDWLIWAGGKCKRDNVISLTVVTAEQLAQEKEERDLRIRASVEAESRFAAAKRSEEERAAEQLRQIEAVKANYRITPTPGRAQALVNYGLCPAAVLMEAMR